MHGGHMSLLAVFALSYSLATAKRIQPSAQISRTLHSAVPTESRPSSAEDAPVSVQSETGLSYHKSPFDSQSNPPSQLVDGAAPTNASVSQSGDIWQHTLFRDLAHVGSTIEEHVCITQVFKTAMNIAKTYMGLESYFSLIILGAGLMALMFCGHRLAQTFTPHPSQGGNRMRYLHNGRVVYEWDQTTDVATLYIKPPHGVRKTDLDIRVAPRHLRVGRKGKPSFLTAEIYDFVNEVKSSWSLQRNGELQIFLRKTKPATWPTVLLHSDKSGGQGYSIPAMNSKFKPAPFSPAPSPASTPRPPQPK